MKKEIKWILAAFLMWRLVTVVSLLLSIQFLPLQENFLGGRLVNYVKAPWFWAWGNFDGEHYMSISQKGYENLTYFFFPFFPLLMRFFAGGMWKGLSSYLTSGLFVSHVSFFIGLVGFWKLLALDYGQKVSKLAILLLLFFPASFYFGSIYTESVFFALVVWSFFFAREKRWLLAGILGGLSVLTRIVGVVLLPALLIEYYYSQKPSKRDFIKAWPLLFIPLALGGYMYYLKTQTGDPLEFFSTLSVFGEQRGSSLVFFPRVFYRYIFKVLPNLNYSNILLFFTPWLEFITALVFLALSVFSFFKLRLSYATYLSLGFILPTLSGSFSSFPRYALVLFPGFILGSLLMVKVSKKVQIGVFTLFLVGLILATAMFSRGYWLA